jgi:hypothetical protein
MLGAGGPRQVSHPRNVTIVPFRKSMVLLRETIALVALDAAEAPGGLTGR